LEFFLPNKGDLVMSTQKIIEANVQNSNTIVVLNGGNISANGPVTVAPGIDYMGFDSKGQPYVAEGDKTSFGISEVNAAGNWDVDGSEDLIAKGGGVTSQLAGVSYNGLKSGGVNMQRQVNKRESVKTVHILSWDYATGAATYGTPAVTTDALGNDDAARMTRAIPGEFVYIANGKTPVNDTYDAKTGG
jgi:hypothetical protein